MIYSSIGNTGLSVSGIGLGTVKFGRNLAVKYPTQFSIPDDKQLLNVLATAKECGINLIDTAPAYGVSEERLGKLLPKIKRDWVVCTKVGERFDTSDGQSVFDFSFESIEASLKKSLKHLKRDVLNMVLVHSDGNDLKIIEAGTLEILNHFKKKGWVQAVGMSTKTVEGGILAAQNSDVIMVTHNITHRAEQAVIDFAGENNVGVLIKKPLASGHISNQESVVSNFCEILKNKQVSSMIIGSINADHIVDNCNIYNSLTKK